MTTARRAPHAIHHRSAASSDSAPSTSSSSARRHDAEQVERCQVAGVEDRDDRDRVDDGRARRILADRGARHEIDDAYRYGRVIGDYDLYLFGEGNHTRIYDKLGARRMSEWYTYRLNAEQLAEVAGNRE